MPFLTRQPIFTLWNTKSTVESSNSDELVQRQPIYVEKNEKNKCI